MASRRPAWLTAPRTVACVVLGLCAVMPGASAKALEAPRPPAAAPLISLSVGGTTLVSVPSVGGSSSGTPTLGVSALETTPTETQLVGVSVEGTPVLTVSTPSLPAVETPALPVETPAVSTPSVPTAPVNVASTPTSSTPTPSRPAPTHASPSVGSASSATAATARQTPPSGATAPAHAGTRRSGGPARRGARGSGSRVTAAGRSAPSPATALVSAARPARSVTGTTTASIRATTHQASNPLDALGRQIPLPLPVPDWSKPIILALLLLAMWFGVRSRLAGRRARRLETQRATLLQDVGAMQAALVPEVPARVGGLAVTVAYRPADGPAAGGDFYDLFIPAPGKVAVILGDVAGHGREALTQAALTRYTLRAYVQAGLEPRLALALAGRALADPMCEHFATVAVGVYDSGSATLTYALAGHPPPIVRGCETSEPLSVCCSPPLGAGFPTGLRQSVLSLPAGAELCFFSDGLLEARCEGPEELLGRERLSELFEALGAQPTAEDLLARVRAVAQSTPDDMAACILAPANPVHGPRVHIEELEADQQALAAGHVRRFLDACALPGPEIAPTIELATTIADRHHTALLRVKRHAHGVTASVSAPEDPSPRGTARDESRAEGQPLLHAVSVS